MERPAFLALITAVALASGAAAQHSAPWELLDSPVKVEGEVAAAGESVVCSLPFPPTPAAALFDCDKILGTTPLEFLGNELYSPFRVWHFDETCSGIGNWTTAFSGTTLTGLTFDEQTGTTYWAVDPWATSSIVEYAFGTGVPTGVSIPLATGYAGVWGGLAIDTHAPGKHAFCEEIAVDVAVEYDLVSGAIGGTFANPDNIGMGAYGNDVGDAADPAACSGATMIISSGIVTVIGAERVSQIDKNGTLCYQTWDLRTALPSYGEVWVNGVEEFFSATTFEKQLLCMGSATSAAYILRQPLDVTQCQGVDWPASDVLFVNASRGGPFYDLSIDPSVPLPIAGAMQKPLGAGSGRYVVHLNAGVPNSATITTLPASLGKICYPVLFPPAGTASPVAVWNNLGKTASIGASSYFGTPIANPLLAPSFFWLQPAGDPVNLPYGTTWTIQGIVINPASSSPKGASVTNAIVLQAY